MVNAERWRSRLRDACARSWKKRSAIARDAGVAPETLSRILTGASKQPGFDVVVRITHAAGESVGWVLEEKPYALSLEERALLRRAVATIRKVIPDA